MDKNNLYGKLTAYGENVLLWALCTAATSASVCIYLSTVLNVYTFMAVALTAAIIFFLDFARRKKFGGLLYTAVLVCVSFVPSFLLSGRYEFFNFIRWFFSGSEAVETKATYTLTLTIMMAFLFTSAAYYFTKVIYRSSVITLISLIPFAIAVKTVTVLPWGYPAVIAALDFILFVYYGRKDVLNGAKAGGKAAFMVYTDFTLAVVLLALILPKPSETPYYEKFEKLSNSFQFGGSGETQYSGEYKDFSGTADELKRGESILIYSVSTPDPVYMKTQVFDIYVPESNGWTILREMTGSKSWQENAPLLNYERLGAAVVPLLEGNPQLAELYPSAERLGYLTDIESRSVVYSREFPAVYILAPLRATMLNPTGFTAEYSARTKSGEIFTDLRYVPANSVYILRYYTEDIFDTMMNDGLCDISLEDYGEFLSMAKEAAEDSSDGEKALNEFYKEHTNAVQYREDTLTEVSAEIQSLADELTAGMEYDWQKAEAIERYFHTNGFIYDLAYEAPAESDTPEFFLFESKRGICSDFATSYALLARASGLTVRYTEGFVMQPSGETDGIYSIYTDNAHAYPEVYIPGAGWVIFEPTPSDLRARGSGDGGDEDTIDPLAGLFTGIVVVLGLGLFILIVALTPKFMESIFRVRVKLAKENKAVLMLYSRHLSNAEQKTGENCKPMTSEQMEEYTLGITGISLTPLTEPFRKACYGGISITAEEKSHAEACYKAQYKAMKKRKKRADK